MLNSLEIAKKATLKPIKEIAASIGIEGNCIERYGLHKAKINMDCLDTASRPQGKLILVTAMTPTRAGEGKTTTSVGLVDAMNRIGKKTVVALREPSLGPVFGMKGGATGGGYAQVVPSDEINLHFTGDLHAISSAHNLLSAMVDNRVHFDGTGGLLDSRRVTWRRVVDMNDRVLRDIVVGIGGPFEGIARETGFDITAASEVMAIFCLARDPQDLKERLGNIVIGSTPDGEPVRARQIKAHGAMTALLMDAIHPNIVQTLEGNAALVHGGPFANIAHGTNSVIATRAALSLAPYVVTECGFGSDLGAEKFFNVVVRGGNIPAPSACVLVATLRALKLHGGVPFDQVAEENVGAVRSGFCNLEKHYENMRAFGMPVVVALNSFPSDTDAERAALRELCEAKEMRLERSDVFMDGGAGGEALAKAVVEAAEHPTEPQFTYETDATLFEKIDAVADKVYGAARVVMEGKTRRKITRLQDQGFGGLPICIAKTQYSFSSDPKKLARPEGFNLIVTDARLSAGAGFVVILCGDIMTMPGLPRTPAAENVDILDNGEIVGLQ